MASGRAARGWKYVGGWSYQGIHRIKVDEDYFLQIDSFAEAFKLGFRVIALVLGYKLQLFWNWYELFVKI